MTGRTLLHYNIVEKLGEGGMGVVWKARDTHLDRFVAFKTLPAEKLADPERKRRFAQEAKAASALNHPNIVHIYDITEADGVQFIAMEYVAGKTLDQLIGRRGLRLNEVLKYGVQIADALARAHAAGIIHRDLKPSNIMVDEHGLVKVLDFGLAKLTEVAPGDAGETATMRAGTEEGSIVGTVAYMSPEQAEAKPVDARSDIFSFGSVLYEMVTGQRAFRGDSKLSTLSAVLKDEPRPPSSVAQDVPRDLEKIITHCLRKDPARRFQHIDDVKTLLEELKEESESGKLAGMAEATPRARRKRRLAWGAGLSVVVLVAAAGLWLRFFRPTRPALLPKTVPLTSYAGDECCPSFSPDGNQVAFVWNGPKRDNDDIYIKLVGTENAVRLTSDPAPDNSPAWSPDGRYIAFLRELSKGKQGVFLIPAIGGPERKLTEIQSYGRLSDLAWHPDGKWLAISDQGSIWLLSVDTTEKRKLTSPPAGASDHTPAFSPDGRRLAFSRNFAALLSEIYLLGLTDDFNPKGESKQLTFKRRFSKWPVWTADGREIIALSGTGVDLGESELWRMPAEGGPLQPLLGTSVAGYTPAISHKGDRLAYTRLIEDTNIWRIEVPGPNRKAGEPVSLIASTYPDDAPQYSPDGKKIVFTSGRSGHVEVWVCASDGSNPVQLTTLQGFTGSPRWSPDGQRIVFDSTLEGQSQLYMIDASGGNPRRLTHHSADDAVASWSRDGRWIYFVSNRTRQWQIWKMPAEGGEAVQVTRHGGYVAFESLDGKFLYIAKSLMQTGLWRVPVEGGEETKILDSILGGTYAVASRGVYFAAPHPDGTSDIQFLSFATGRMATIAVHRPVEDGLSVSPDERFVVYTQGDQRGSNLVLVENFR